MGWQEYDARPFGTAEKSGQIILLIILHLGLKVSTFRCTIRSSMVSFQKALRDYWNDSAQKSGAAGLWPVLRWFTLPVAVLLAMTPAAVRRILPWF